MMLMIVSAASFPPSQKARGRGTRDSGHGREMKPKKGPATRQKVLGHSTLEMTRRCANLMTEDLQAVHERVSLLSCVR